MPAELYTPVKRPDDEIAEVLSRIDVPCPSCGYSLRGLRGPTCPECGDRVDLDAIEAHLRSTGWGVLRSPGMFGACLLAGAFSGALVSGSGALVLLWMTLGVLWVNSMFVWSLEVFWFRRSLFAWAPSCALVVPMLALAACSRFC